MALVCLIFLSCAERSSNWKIDNIVKSPDDGYVATIYTISGGGAAGWCEQRIEINSKDKPFDMEKTKGADFCFSADCGKVLQVKWESTNSIQIKYTIGDGVSIYQRRTPLGLPVRIDYVME
jgi:hypothetical protein